MAFYSLTGAQILRLRDLRRLVGPSVYARTKLEVGVNSPHSISMTKEQAARLIDLLENYLDEREKKAAGGQAKGRGAKTK